MSSKSSDGHLGWGRAHYRRWELTLEVPIVERQANAVEAQALEEFDVLLLEKVLEELRQRRVQSASLNDRVYAKMLSSPCRKKGPTSPSPQRSQARRGSGIRNRGILQQISDIRIKIAHASPIAYR